MKPEMESRTGFVVKGTFLPLLGEGEQDAVVYGDVIDALWHTEDFGDQLVEWVLERFPEEPREGDDVARRIATSVKSPLYTDTRSPLFGDAPMTRSLIQERTDNVRKSILPELTERLNSK